MEEQRNFLKKGSLALLPSSGAVNLATVYSAALFSLTSSLIKFTEDIACEFGRLER